MERIEGHIIDRQELAKQALSWITCSKRQLSTAELLNALAVELGESEFHDDNLPDLDDVISACLGLVTVDEQSNTVRLAHYTTYAYFQRSWDRWFQNAHGDIATRCVTYLSFDRFQSGLALPMQSLKHDWPNILFIPSPLRTGATMQESKRRPMN